MVGVALAGLSVRALAQAAACEGIDAVALDLFGDLDTCRAATAWLPIGTSDSMQIDAAALLDALRALAARGDVQGWVAGAGFEGCPELLAAAAQVLPLFGTAASDQRRVRDPLPFFAFLRERGFEHPAVRPLQAGDTAGWLTKDAGGCGGWHITRAADARPAHATHQLGLRQHEPHPHNASRHAPHRLYQQCEARGVSMSATFIADGREAVVLGFNEQLVRPLGARPHVYHGVLGPVPVSAAVAAHVIAAVQACTAAFALRGLASLDFLLDGERVRVLEVNPRPPASLALYPRVGAGGVLQAHLDACTDARLPRDAAHGPDLAPNPAIPLVRGNEVVYATQALALDANAARRLEQSDHTHDLPRGAMRFAAADPVCSVSASGASADIVKAELARRRESVLALIPEFST